jgi:YcxB-like protein
VTIVYVTRFRDLWLFNAMHQFRSIPFQALYGGLAAFGAWSAVNESQCHSYGACAVQSLVTFVLFYLAMTAMQFVFNAAFLVSRQNQNVLTEHRVELRRDGLYEETKYSQCMFLWPGILRIVTAAGFIAVYVTAHSAVLIPDKCFDSPDQRARFLDAMKSGTSAA